MPELPEVECLVRGLQQRVVGWRIQRVEFRRQTLREPLDRPAINAALLGHTLHTVTRRGKYLLISRQDGHGVIAHLGMTGNLIMSPQAQPLNKHAHVIFHLVQDRERASLQFIDPRRFGRLAPFTPNGEVQHPWLMSLGVEPLTHRYLARYLWQKSKARRVPIKNFLMNAHIVVGIGNIYASESLHAARIYPYVAAGELTYQDYQRLARAIKKILRQAITAGGTSFRDYRDLGGNPGYFTLSLAVYGKQGEPCPRCRTLIVSSKSGGRSTFYCPACTQ